MTDLWAVSALLSLGVFVFAVARNNTKLRWSATQADGDAAVKEVQRFGISIGLCDQPHNAAVKEVQRFRDELENMQTDGQWYHLRGDSSV